MEDALNAERTSCEAMKRKFLTPHVLFALLELPDSKVTECFEETSRGLAQEWRERYEYVRGPASEGCYPRFEKFDWDDRFEVRQAKEIAYHDGKRKVGALHLLLGVLDKPRSRTQRELGERLGPEGLRRMRKIAISMLQEEET